MFVGGNLVDLDRRNWAHTYSAYRGVRCFGDRRAIRLSIVKRGVSAIELFGGLFEI